MQVAYDKLVEKWSPVLNEESAGSIKDAHRKAVTAAILENQEKALMEEGMIAEAAPTNNTGAAANWNPILIALVRRAMPNLMAYDVCGVQPMTGPTGLIFAMRSRYKTAANGQSVDDEALFDEANTGYSGDSSFTQPTDGSGLGTSTDGDGDSTIADSVTTALAGSAMPLADAEALGSTGGSAFNEMGFTIEKATVTAKSRALKAEHSLELA